MSLNYTARLRTIWVRLYSGLKKKEKKKKGGREGGRKEGWGKEERKERKPMGKKRNEKPISEIYMRHSLINHVLCTILVGVRLHY